MTDLLLSNEPSKSSNSFDKQGSRRAGWVVDSARPEQLPTDGEDWTTWLYLAGRGAGKTRTAAEWLAWEAIRANNTRWAVVAPTFGDARDTCAEGESGLLPILNQYEMLDNYNRSIGEIRLKNGSRIKLFSADQPDRLRGPQHHGAWCDELAAWRYLETYDQLMFGLRLGDNPRTVITTTPKPLKLIRDLLERENVKVVRGSTFDNASNLAASALVELQARYEGTRMGRQELYGEVLEDVEGALWTNALLDDTRVDSHPDLRRVVVAIDPSGGSSDSNDWQGIVVAGEGTDGELYILADRSVRDTPAGWARAAIRAYRDFEADRIVAEKNFGGEMVESTIRQVDANVPVRMVTASRGKLQRAEPVAALYEQGRVHHVGRFPLLEDQMLTWTPASGTSPDRMDAMVWAITELSKNFSGNAWIQYMRDRITPGEEPIQADDRESLRQAAFKAGDWNGSN